MPARRSQANLAQVLNGTSDEFALACIHNAADHSAPDIVAISPVSAKPTALPIRLIPIETVCEMLGLKRSATLRMVADGILDPPLKFGTSRRAAARWVEQEIVDFINQKASERKTRTPAPQGAEVAK